MTNEMIERVTKAIEAKIGDLDGCYSEKCRCSGAASVLECKIGVTIEQIASAAIAAMREPTDAMLESARWMDCGENYLGTGGAGYVWETMIASALAEEGSPAQSLGA